MVSNADQKCNDFVTFNHGLFQELVKTFIDFIALLPTYQHWKEKMSNQMQKKESLISLIETLILRQTKTIGLKYKFLWNMKLTEILSSFRTIYETFARESSFHVQISYIDFEIPQAL